MLEPLKGTVSSKDLFSFGVDDLAYIKDVVVEGQKMSAVFAADGTPLAIIPERSVAFATVRQFDMEPRSVH